MTESVAVLESSAESVPSLSRAEFNDLIQKIFAADHLVHKSPDGAVTVWQARPEHKAPRD